MKPDYLSCYFYSITGVTIFAVMEHGVTIVPKTVLAGMKQCAFLLLENVSAHQVRNKKYCTAD